MEAELTQYEKELAYRVPYSYESLLLTIWTMKEALSNVLKTRLAVPLSILEVRDIEAHAGYFISRVYKFSAV